MWVGLGREEMGGNSQKKGLEVGRASKGELSVGLDVWFKQK